MIDVLPLETTSLGDRSYLATDGEVALVVDPQRDIDRVLGLAAERGLRITHVAETHIHNDYVSGGLQLARSVGAEYLVGADDEVSFDRRGVRDGDIVEIGGMRLRLVHTPGHTFTHLAYVLEHPDATAVGVFSGGSLLFGSTGRPDLLGERHAEGLARRQYVSVHRLVAELPGSTELFPTHGFGSYCSAGQTEAVPASTLAREASINPVLTQGQESFVEGVLAGLVPFPAYYTHMGSINSAGPGPVQLTPPERADPSQLRRRIASGEWVVDLRARATFAATHLPGTLNIGLDGGFVTQLGSLIPWGTPVTLIGATGEDVAAAQRELVRIGIDRPEAMATGIPEEWGGGEPLASYPCLSFADLARETAGRGQPLVLDVRRDDERALGNVAGSVHVPLHDLLTRMDDVPSGRPVWVHCATGYRASVAAALLARAGRDVVLIDDDYEAAATVGLPTVADAPSPSVHGTTRSRH